MAVREPVFVFQHVGTDTDDSQRARQAKLGCAPAHRLFELLDVQRRDGVSAPRSFADYRVTFSQSRLPKGVRVGFLVIGEGGSPALHWDALPEGLGQIETT